jgi:hypothetical protein
MRAETDYTTQMDRGLLYRHRSKTMMISLLLLLQCQFLHRLKLDHGAKSKHTVHNTTLDHEAEMAKERRSNQSSTRVSSHQIRGFRIQNSRYLKGNRSNGAGATDDAFRCGCESVNPPTPPVQ